MKKVLRRKQVVEYFAQSGAHESAGDPRRWRKWADNAGAGVVCRTL
jgi:hypothetical protein